MFNRQNIKEFRSDFQLAVAKLEEQYGCNISLGTISFDDNELKSKMTARKGEKVVKATKDDFQIGDIVFINHKKIANTRTFEILKINNKNIKVRDRDNNSLLTVSPSLLSK